MAVQLAYPGEYIAADADVDAAVDAYTDKAGGTPVWSSEFGPPPASTQQCGICAGPLFLLAQLYLPATKRVPTASILYVQACNRAGCGLDANKRGWMRALRLRIGSETSNSSGSIAPSANAASTTAAAAIAATSTAAPSIASSASSVPSSADATAPSPTVTAPSPQPPASVSAPSPVAASVTATSSADSDDEWGAKASWSSDEDDGNPGAKAKKKEKKKNATKSSEDTDAMLAALLAQQTLQTEEAKAKKAAAAAKAAAKAAKAAEKEEQRRQAEQELREAAMKAREAAEAQEAASAASASVAASSPTAAAARPSAATSFRPFYLLWCPEPAAQSAELTRELRLLREYEARMKEEGAEDELEAITGASFAGAAPGGRSGNSGTGNGSGSGGGASNPPVSESDDDDEDDVDRREDEVQSFFDRIERLSEQCVRYYEPPHAAAAACIVPTGALFSTRAQQQQGAASRRCPHCAACMVLEVQLMPTLLYEMHVEAVDARDPGMDWTTVDVYTCTRACTSNEYIEEMVHVQPPL